MRGRAIKGQRSLFRTLSDSFWNDTEGEENWLRRGRLKSGSTHCVSPSRLRSLLYLRLLSGGQPGIRRGKPGQSKEPSEDT